MKVLTCGGPGHFRIDSCSPMRQSTDRTPNSVEAGGNYGHLTFIDHSDSAMVMYGLPSESREIHLDANKYLMPIKKSSLLVDCFVVR